jgi:hypothetical protein
MQDDATVGLLQEENSSSEPMPKNGTFIYTTQDQSAYYLRYFGGFLVSLVLPGVEHFFISQWQKAIVLTVTCCFLRYVILTGLSVGVYFVQTDLTRALWGQILVTILLASIGALILANEYLVFFDFTQLLSRLWHGFPVAQGEFSIRCFAIGACCLPHYFWTWYPDHPPKGWIDAVRDVESRLRISF